jgi:uncharacterized membrane protein (Fun14 family)
MQLMDTVNPGEIFPEDFMYFSSYSSSLLRRSEEFVHHIQKELELDKEDLVIEVASNDGYLLQYFVKDGYRNVLGIEPAESVAYVAREKGVNTMNRFFGRELAEELLQQGKARLIVANNVIAHVPDLQGFIAGFDILLADDGLASIEFQHLQSLIENSHFDLIYHEHYSYFSLHAIKDAVERHDLQILDAEPVDAQGGSLRILVSKKNAKKGLGVRNEVRVQEILAAEKEAGLLDPYTFKSFAERTEALKERSRKRLRGYREAGEKVACYGAAAKGSSFLNYIDIEQDWIEYVVDKNPHKQGRFMAGTNLPVFAPERLLTDKPDVLIILPWNLRREIEKDVRDLGLNDVEFVCFCD